VTDGLGEHADWLDRWLRETALPLWWRAGADHVRGGWFDALGQDLSPREPRRARVQARQAFVYASAGQVGWDGPWREAAWHGLDTLLERYRRPDGLYRAVMSAEGEVLDDTPRLYEQAFALLAMAAMHRADPGRRDLSAEAGRLLTALEQLRHPGGGFRETYAHPFQANANMHLFEAALAWIDAGGGAPWRALADEIAELALTRFIDPDGGFLREMFDERWRPAPGEDGRRVEPGHQFEWAYLLDRWSALTGAPGARDGAGRLYAAGLRGVDDARGAVVEALQDDFSVLEPRARLWGQTEWLRASATFGAPAEQAAAASAVRRFLEAATPGLWREHMRPDGGFVEEPAPASSFYHLIGAIADLPKTDGRTALPHRPA
jgi:mannose/cellobiose epimerase-like protein (N-acyl-D-glucosamine 2-epimerase family)